jgi:hypothetical protein
MSKLTDIASKLEGKLQLTKTASRSNILDRLESKLGFEKTAQEMMKVQMDIGQLGSRLNQFATSGSFSTAASGVALDVVNRILAGMAITKEEKDSAIADLQHYSVNNDPSHLNGLKDDELKRAIELVSTAKTATASLQSAIVKIAKLESKYERTFSKIAEGVFKKVVNANGEEVKVPAVFTVCPECEGRGKQVDTELNVTAAKEELPVVEYLKLISAQKCDCCGGKRVVKVAAPNATDDEKKLVEEAKKKKVEKKKAKEAKKAEKKVKKLDKKKAKKDAKKDKK